MIIDLIWQQKVKQKSAETYLRLTADDDKDEDALQRVDQIGHDPDVVRAADGPGDDVRHPGDTHHDHQLEADAPQRGTVRGRRNQTAAKHTTWREKERGEGRGQTKRGREKEGGWWVIKSCQKRNITHAQNTYTYSP